MPELAWEDLIDDALGPDLGSREATAGFMAAMAANTRKGNEVGIGRLSWSLDLSTRPGVAAGVAYVVLSETTVNKRVSKDVPMLVALARMADGTARGGTTRVTGDEDLGKLADDLVGKVGSFASIVLLARRHVEADVESTVRAVVEKVLGRPPETADQGRVAPGADGVGWAETLRRARVNGWSKPTRWDDDARRSRKAPGAVKDTHRNGMTSLARRRLAASHKLASAFLDGLDATALALAGTAPVRDLLKSRRPGLWEALDRTFDRGARLAAALAVEPGLAWAICASWAADPTAFEALATGESVIEAAVSHGRVERRHLASLASCLSAISGAPPVVPPAILGKGDPATALVRSIAPYPRNWHPTDAPGWLAFARCVAAARWGADMHAQAPQKTLGGAGRWEEHANRLEALAGQQGVATAVSGISDLARALSRQVLRPALALAGAPTEGADEAALAILASGRTVVRVLETAREWHAAEARISAVAAGLPWPKGRRRAWPPGYPDLRMGGLSAVVLTDDGQLADEGRKGRNPDGTTGLSHCVGGYASSCRRGECRILSIRAVDDDGTTTRLSTAELVMGRSGVVTALQHLGAGNRPPPAKAVAFLARYLKLVGAGTLDVATAELAPRAEASDPHLEAGYDLDAPGNWEQVRDAWAPLLPRAARGMAPGDLAAAVGAFRANGHGTWSPDAFGGAAWRHADAA